MRAKSQAPKQINKGPATKVVEKNKKIEKGLVRKEDKKENKPEVVKTRPKSEIPGFDFSLSFPKVKDIQVSEKISQIMNEDSLFPKSVFSDTDCPPTPPDCSLYEISESGSKYETPKVKEKSDFGTQTDRKRKNFQSEGVLRRSSRLASKKLTKTKVEKKYYTVKKIKYN